VFHPILAASGAVAVNLPLVVVGVFAATFVMVCAIAYLFLGRSSSSAERSAPAGSTRAPEALRFDITSREPQPSFEPPAPGETSFGVVQPAPRPESIASDSAAAAAADRIPSIAPDAPAAKKAPLLMLYRVLMFATGGTGLLAAYLMFSAVEGFSRLLVIGIVVLILSLVALYRGFVPDPELTRK
jgi:hypothetical protein